MSNERVPTVAQLQLQLPEVSINLETVHLLSALKEVLETDLKNKALSGQPIYLKAAQVEVIKEGKNGSI